MVVWARRDGGAATLEQDKAAPTEYQTSVNLPADPQFVGPTRVAADWEPSRVVPHDNVDLRQSVNHASRRTVNKRRREEAADLLRGREDVDAMEADHEGGAAGKGGASGGGEPAAPMTLSKVSSSKRARVEGSPYRTVSGKTWKVASARAGAAKAAVLGKNSSWEKVSARRDQRRAAVAQKREAVASAKERRRAAGKQRADAKERKKANQARSAVLQPISNPATLKKMMKSKKQRKLLRKMDTTKVEAP